jgi:hypothetical protein
MDKYFGISEYPYEKKYALFAEYLAIRKYIVKNNMIFVPISEERADRRARPIYEQIRSNLMDWAQDKRYLNDCKNWGVEE